MAGILALSVVLVAGVVGTGVGFLSWLHRDRPGAVPLTVFAILAGCWALVQGLELASATPGATAVWAQVGMALSAFIPVAWLLTVLEYTGRERWLRPGRVGLLLVEPLAFSLLVWSNGGAHELVWENARHVMLDGTSVYAVDYGLAFWANQAVLYLVVAAGGLLLLRTLVGTVALYRGQSTALLGAIALPAIANAVEIFGLAPPGFDPAAAGYVLTGVVLAWALFRWELFSLSPLTRELGREEAIADLDDRVIVLDGTDRIVDVNPAAESLLGAPGATVLGEPLEAAVPDLAAALDAGTTDDVALEYDGKLRYFDVRVSDLGGPRRSVSGRLVSLRDVTERRQREQRLDVLNRLLRHNLRNDLNVVRGNAELARQAVSDPVVAERLDKVVDTVDDVVDRSGKIGRLTRALDAETLAPVHLETVVSDALRALETERESVDVAVEVPADQVVRGGYTLTAAVEEILENALQHGGPDPRVTVAVDEAASDDRWVVLTVSDAGPGIEPHEYRSVVAGEETPLQHGSGVGLWLVNWLVTQVGGSVAFEGHEDGTTVRFLLPRADENAPADGETERTAAESHGRRADANADPGARPPATDRAPQR